MLEEKAWYNLDSIVFLAMAVRLEISKDRNLMRCESIRKAEAVTTFGITVRFK
jgi:hypothetical protein